MRAMKHKVSKAIFERLSASIIELTTMDAAKAIIDAEVYVPGNADGTTG